MKPTPQGLRLVFLGAPGAGKGTQAEEFAKEHGVAHLSTGDMLRKAIAQGTPVGRTAKPYLESGKLVPDDVMWGVVSERLDQRDCVAGFVLDGFPRTVPQASELAAKLAAQETPLSHVIFFDVPDEELIRRLLSRGRADDTSPVIRERLRNYALLTKPLTDWYRGEGLLRPLDGTGTPAQVRARLNSIARAGPR